MSMKFVSYVMIDYKLSKVIILLRKHNTEIPSATQDRKIAAAGHHCISDGRNP